MITKKLIPYIIAMLALLCCGCYSDCDFPETIIFPKEGGTMIVDCKYDPAFCSLRDDEGYGEIRYRCEVAENRPPDDSVYVPGLGEVDGDDVILDCPDWSYGGKYKWVTFTTDDAGRYVITAKANTSGKSRRMTIEWQEGNLFFEGYIIQKN